MCTTRNCGHIGLYKWGKIGTSVCGMILLAAFSLKLLDDFFFIKLTLSSLFTMGVLIDLVVGSLLISNSTSIVSSLIGAVVFLIYTGYQIVFSSLSCDCFGRLSGYVSSYSHLGVTVVCMSICTCITYLRFVQVSHPSTRDHSGWKAELLKQSALVMSVCFALLAIRQTQDYPILFGIIKTSAVEEEGARVKGMVRIQNASLDPIALLGSMSSSCKGGIKIDGPVDIKPGKFVELEGVFAPSSKSIFAQGSSDVIISRDGAARKFRLNWVAKFGVDGSR
jgi:hypothetical protein